MRVVAGTQKGRRLKPPHGWDCRPTASRVREALFSILAPHVEGASILDLYAGTGALGLEALSRGASHAVFVENQAAAVRLLRDNIARCGYDQCAIVHAQDVESFFPAPPVWPARDESRTFDIVFADPPYQHADPTQVLVQLSLNGRLSSDGRVVVEHFVKRVVPTRVGSLAQTRQARYGDTMLTFYQRLLQPAEAACK